MKSEAGKCENLFQISQIEPHMAIIKNDGEKTAKSIKLIKIKFLSSASQTDQ
jgi:hypothetical protein